MVAAERISPLVSRVLAPNPSLMTLSGTNSYLVGRDELAVVDPGPDIPEHVEAIVAAAAQQGRLALSLVTHHHGDHLPAAIRLRERLGTPIAGHPALPEVDRRLEHDELIAVGVTRLRALATPGHTLDHLCYLLEEERLLFSGDLIAGSGTVIVGDGRLDLVDYLASLRLVAGVGARMILPGHGLIVERPAEKIDEYLEHRLMREQQIVGALAGGPRTVDALVTLLYAEVALALHPMAARNVRAHLYKLAHEGRVTESDDAWRRVESGVRP